MVNSSNVVDQLPAAENTRTQTHTCEGKWQLPKAAYLPAMACNEHKLHVLIACEEGVPLGEQHACHHMVLNQTSAWRKHMGPQSHHHCGRHQRRSDMKPHLHEASTKCGFSVSDNVHHCMSLQCAQAIVIWHFHDPQEQQQNGEF